jgi:hypothetical protein
MPESLVQRRVPRVGYAYTLAAILGGLLLAILSVAVWCRTLPPLQHVYLWTYLRYGLVSRMPLPSQHQVRFAIGAAYLRQNIFGGHSVLQVFLPALIATGTCLTVAVFFGMGLDAKRLNDFRKGKKLRGWDILTPRQFNRRTQGDGFALYIE